MIQIPYAAARRHWLLGTALSALLASQSAHASAAEPAPAERSKPSDANSVPQQGQMEEIVVTARGRVERLTDVPVSATVLDTAEVQRVGTSLNNLSTLVPSLRIGSGGSGAGGSIALRGVSGSISNAGLEQKVAINLDGVQVSRARFITAGFFDAQNVQVLKGPQSLYFGKNATAGVLSITSADPDRDPGGYVQAGYEAVAHEYLFEGAYSLPLSDTARFRIAALYSDMTRGYLHNDAPIVVEDGQNSGIPPFSTVPRTRNFMGRGTLVLEPSTEFDAKLKVTYSNTNTDGGKQSPSQAVCRPGATNQGVSNGVPETWDDCKLNDHVVNAILPPLFASQFEGAEDGSGYTRAQTVLSSLQMNYKFSDLTLTSVTGLAYLNFEEFGDASGTAYWYVIGGSREKYTQFSQELRLASNYAGPINFTVGAFFQKSNDIYSILGQGGAVGLQPDPATGLRMGFINRIKTLDTNFSTFAQLRWKIVPALELALGGRYTHDDKDGKVGNTFVNQTVASRYLPQGQFVYPKISDDNFSPEATLTWHATDDIMVYGAYRQAELTGGISAPSTLGPTVTAANSVFRPEKAKGVEVGIKFSALSSALHGEVVLFRTDYSDLQVAQFNSQTISYLIANAGKARTQGVEFTARARVSSRLTFRADATYQDAKYIDFQQAQCYSGQTATTGCVAISGTSTGAQDLTGRTLPRSPKFAASVGLDYGHEVGGGWSANLNLNLRHSSSYLYVDSLNPNGFQKAFETLDVGIALSNDQWKLGFVGRNLTNEFYATQGADQPTGKNSQVMGIVARPRELVFQIARKF